MGHNLADLPPEERAAMDADRAACLIRWKVRDMSGKDRQAAAKQLLGKYPADQLRMIQQALERRANGSGK